MVPALPPQRMLISWQGSSVVLTAAGSGLLSTPPNSFLSITESGSGCAASVPHRPPSLRSSPASSISHRCSCPTSPTYYCYYYHVIICFSTGSLPAVQDTDSAAAATAAAASASYSQSSREADWLLIWITSLRLLSLLFFGPAL